MNLMCPASLTAGNPRRDNTLLAGTGFPAPQGAPRPPDIAKKTCFLLTSCKRYSLPPAKETSIFTSSWVLKAGASRRRRSARRRLVLDLQTGLAQSCNGRVIRDKRSARCAFSAATALRAAGATR
jgi:hypothetical protein